MTSPPNSSTSVAQLERSASDKLKPFLIEHVEYLATVYILAFLTQTKFNDKKTSEITQLSKALLLLLGRITDFLRSISILLQKGYPEQAGSLASSIFELAHTALYFNLVPESAEKWVNSTSIDDEIPKLLGNKLNWYKVVMHNCTAGGKDGLSEYRVYKQLCWMKHSLPMMQGFSASVQEGTEYWSPRVGPYDDALSVKYARFYVKHIVEFERIEIAR